MRRTLVAAAALLLAATSFMPLASAAPDWGVPVLLEHDDAGSAASPSVAEDAGGNATAVWSQSDGFTVRIWAARANESAPWGAPVLLSGGSNDAATDPVVVADDSGGALALWRERNGTTYNLFSSRFLPVSGWSARTSAEGSSFNVNSAAVLASDGSGRATAAWIAYDGYANSVMGNRYDPGSGWLGAQLLEAAPGGAIAPAIAMASNGDAVAAWRQDDGLRWSIFSNEYTHDVGWGTAVPVELDNLSTADNVRVAMDNSGVTFAVFGMYNDTTNVQSIWASRRPAAATWEAPTMIEQDPFPDSAAAVACVDGGAFVVVFSSDDGARHNLWSAKYTQAGGWAAAAPMESWDGDALGVALDGRAGFAEAVWAHSDGTRFNAVAAQFDAAGGWGMPHIIETNNQGDVGAPAVAVSAGREASAVWAQAGISVTSIWATRLAEGLAPLALTLDEPPSGTVTYNSTVLVAGTVTPGAQVEVNGQLVLVAGNGSWSVHVALQPGTAEILAHAWDVAGNSVQVNASVEYADAGADYGAELAEARAQLAATWEQLNQSLAQINASQAQIQETQGELNATQANLSRLSAQPTSSDALPLALGAAGLLAGVAAVALSFRNARRAPRAEKVKDEIKRAGKSP